MWESLRADIALARQRRPEHLSPYVFPQLFAVFMYRLPHAVGRWSPFGGRFLMTVSLLLTGSELDWRATFGPGLSWSIRRAW